MSYEYVRVSFPKLCRVLIDGADCGLTEEVLRVDPGSHRFELAGMINYEPDFDERVIEDTNPLKPARIVFRVKSL